MKKISILFVAAMMMVSCGYKAKTIALETEADSVNYALGVLFASNCQDSTDEGIKEFLDAVKAGHNGEWEDMPQTEKIGLHIGIGAAEFVTEGLAGRPEITFNGEVFFQALVNTWLDDTTTIPSKELMPFWMRAAVFVFVRFARICANHRLVNAAVSRCGTKICCASSNRRRIWSPSRQLASFTGDFMCCMARFRRLRASRRPTSKSRNSLCGLGNRNSAR